MQRSMGFAVIALATVVAVAFPPCVAGQSTLKKDVIKAFEDGLKKENEPTARVVIAAGLIRFAPDHKDAAKELVSALKAGGDLAGIGQQEISKVIISAPVALVEALIELSKDDKYRRVALDLLIKIDPKALQ